MSLILLDTNVLIYSYDQNDPEKQAQAVLILENLHQANNGCISVQSLAEFMNVGLKKLKPPLSPDKAIYQVQLMQNLWQIFDLTPEIVLTAERGVRDYRLAYYDAQIWATALMNGVSVIFSEDFQDNTNIEGVTCLNPFLPEFKIEDWV